MLLCSYKFASQPKAANTAVANVAWPFRFLLSRKAQCRTGKIQGEWQKRGIKTVAEFIKKKKQKHRPKNPQLSLFQVLLPMMLSCISPLTTEDNSGYLRKPFNFLFLTEV